MLISQPEEKEKHSERRAAHGIGASRCKEITPRLLATAPTLPPTRPLSRL